jgi:hypothetical protein
LLLGVAFVLSRACRPRPALRPVLFLLLALVPVLIIGGFLIAALLQGRASTAAIALLCVYALAGATHGLRMLTGRWQLRAPAAAVILIGAFYAYSRLEDLTPTLWAPAQTAAREDEDSATDVPPAAAEELLFDQREAIDQAVERMTPGDGSGPAVFFVGFAGVGDQRVFAEEIKLAARVVDARFAIADRRLLLINDRRDLDTYPIATATGLGYALRAVADKMNPERDVLFLALSSHGSSDPVLSVSLGSLDLEQLSADDLDTALRDSGIKWRIIVISACYAGAFMKPLENPDTIVIAAAAPDKTSFGCSDDRDLTYFGEAFYRDALPGAKTLAEAFDRARAAIAVRERQEGETPSEPQAFFGTAIGALLERHPMRAAPVSRRE